MSEDFTNESLFDLFIFETTQNIEQLEQLVLNHKNTGSYTKNMVDEIFRVMHTVKGSAAMMQFDGISGFAHKLEDLFSILREDRTVAYDEEDLSDLVLGGVDFIKSELGKLTSGKKADGNADGLEKRIAAFAQLLKNAAGAPSKRKKRASGAVGPPETIAPGKAGFMRCSFLRTAA